MKKLILLTSLLGLSIIALAQSNDCGTHWIGMATAIHNSEGAVMYDVQYTKKKDCNRYIALEHTFPFKVSIAVYLRGTDWDGKVSTSMFNTLNDIAPNSRYVGTGNWHLFRQVTEVVRVEVTYYKGNDRYEIIYDKDKGINETLINGKSIAAYNAEQAQKRKQQEEQPNNAYNNAVINNNSATNDNLSGGNASPHNNAPPASRPPVSQGLQNNGGNNSNTGWTPADGQRGLEETQAYLNRQNENMQKNAAAISDAIHGLGDAAAGISRSDYFDINDVNSYNIGLILGYDIPLNKDEALGGHGFYISLFQPVFGDHFLFTGEESYHFNNKLSPEYYAPLFKIPATAFVNTGRLSDMDISLHYGPHFYNSRTGSGTFLAIQALIGIKFLFMSDFTLINANSSEAYFREFDTGLPVMFMYGGNIRLFLGDFNITATCEITPTKNITPAIRTNNNESTLPQQELNLSNIRLSIGYRLF